MNTTCLFRKSSNWLVFLALLAGLDRWPQTACGLSIELKEPEIRFPKDYEESRARAILEVLRAKQFEFIGGLYSHWPPRWPTTLVYDGGTQDLNSFLEKLARVDGIRVRVTFSKDLSKETGSALAAGSWWVKYSQASPNTVTVRINLAAPAINPEDLVLWIGRNRRTGRPVTSLDTRSLP